MSLFTASRGDRGTLKVSYMGVRIIVPFLGLAILALAEQKATFTLGNSSVPLSQRDVFARQYACADEDKGFCDSGEGCCPLRGACCGNNKCADEGEACCGYDGNVVPLDGSECCV